MKVVERLRYFFGRSLVGVDDCKKSLLFLVDDGEERSQSKDSAFGPKRHEAFDAASQARVVETTRVPGNGSGYHPSGLCGSSAPHWKQNFASGGLSARQVSLVQWMGSEPCFPNGRKIDSISSPIAAEWPLAAESE